MSSVTKLFGLFEENTVQDSNYFLLNIYRLLELYTWMLTDYALILFKLDIKFIISREIINAVSMETFPFHLISMKN